MLHALDESQRDGLLRALLGAFPETRALVAELYVRTGMKLDEDLDLRGGRRPVFTEVLRVAEDQGWLEALVRTGLQGAPNSRPMRDAASALGVAPLPLRPKPPPLLSPHAPELEKLVRERAPPVLMHQFTERLVAASRAVCWIGLGASGLRNDQAQFGSGFLVGSDLVLTNHHVVRGLLEGKVEPGAVRCRFDRTGGGTHGAEAGLPDGWCLDVSELDELDYALLRLDRPVGQEVAPGGGPRGWLRVAAEPPPLEAKDLFFVVQHPGEIRDGEEGAQRIAPGTVLGFEAHGLRLRHDAGTTGGSSGSPGFTFDLRCAALHQGGSKEWNQAIPLRPILKRLRERAVPAFWA